MEPCELFTFSLIGLVLDLSHFAVASFNHEETLRHLSFIQNLLAQLESLTDQFVDNGKLWWEGHTFKDVDFLNKF